MANVSRYQRDVIIKCNHGVTDAVPEYVSRYRFIAESESWVAVDRAGTETTAVGGVGDGWLPSKPADGPRHDQHKIRCRKPGCGKELSITGDRLENLLSLVAPLSEPVTIAGLQKILRSSSALRRE
jgi:hypothetical protein